MHPRRSVPAGFTLIELLVVVAIIALLISILLPSLATVREQGRTVKCLANLKSIGQGVYLYATSNSDQLPGPLHPAIYRWRGADALRQNGIQDWGGRPPAEFQYEQSRWLNFYLQRAYNDNTTRIGNVTDEVTTCPTLERFIPDEHFRQYIAANAGRPIFPTHYVLNNPPGNNVDENSSPGPLGNVRQTDPPEYFGVAFPGLAGRVNNRASKPMSRIKRAADEWMVADAWYRPGSPFAGGGGQYQQEGPYQVAWSGNALPNFAPHGSRWKTWRVFAATGGGDYSADCQAKRSSKADGKTNTAFFDGHAVGVTSKTLKAGNFTILYGFPGTVSNPQPISAGVVPAWE